MFNDSLPSYPHFHPLIICTEKEYPKRKISKVREESQKPIKSSKGGTKRLKVTESATSKTETISEHSSRQQIASETYRKIKEVEYRKEIVYDKNGMALDYDNNPNEYKKARKRIQNRESAIRSRQRKKNYFSELEVQMEELEEENKRLNTENVTLKAEKKLLVDQLEYFKALVGNMNCAFSTKGSNITPSSENSVHNESYDEEKDIIVDKNWEVKEGELPHLGNYKRPNGVKSSETKEEHEKLVLSRKNQNTAASTAGLFFVAVIM